jgi:hypothetical protein
VKTLNLQSLLNVSLGWNILTYVDDGKTRRKQHHPNNILTYIMDVALNHPPRPL